MGRAKQGSARWVFSGTQPVPGQLCRAAGQQHRLPAVELSRHTGSCRKAGSCPMAGAQVTCRGTGLSRAVGTTWLPPAPCLPRNAPGFSLTLAWPDQSKVLQAPLALSGPLEPMQTLRGSQGYEERRARSLRSLPPPKSSASQVLGKDVNPPTKPFGKAGSYVPTGKTQGTQQGKWQYC